MTPLPPNSRTKKVAFTVIELLAVIAILAILIALLFPALAKTQNKAKLVKCVSNLRQIAVASNLYCADQGKLPPMQGFDAGLDWPWEQTANLTSRLLDYVQDPAVFFCPAAPVNGKINAKIDTTLNRLIYNPSLKLYPTTYAWVSPNKFYNPAEYPDSMSYVRAYMMSIQAKTLCADVPGSVMVSYFGGNYSIKHCNAAMQDGSVRQEKDSSWLFNPANYPP